MAHEYEKNRATFEFLETVAELTDQVELDASRLELMRNPTKSLASEVYLCGIRLWFAEHGGSYEDAFDIQDIAHDYEIRFYG